MPRKKSMKRYKVEKVEEDSPLGLLMKDKITGFKGIAIARIDYLYGCTNFSLKNTSISKDGKVESAVTFDYLQLEIVGNGVYKKEKPKKDNETGGCHPDMPVIK